MFKLLPLAFMNYYPSLILLNKLEKISYPWLAFLSPVVAVIVFALAYMLWTAGLNRYSSTGS
jgi:ABC-2 type transport system permease protein